MREDWDTVQMVLAGDREAFRVLVERHQGRVMAMISRLTEDSEMAEELAQETFVRAYQGLSGFRGESRFSTWVIQIALHVARNHLKQRRRLAKVVSLDELEERDGTQSRVFQETRRTFAADASLEDEELSARLRRAIDQLPHAYREVFVLKHVQELSYEEIAELTGDSVGSLKVRAHRARALLREELRYEDDGRYGDAARSRG